MGNDYKFKSIWTAATRMQPRNTRLSISPRSEEDYITLGHKILDNYYYDFINTINECLSKEESLSDV